MIATRCSFATTAIFLISLCFPIACAGQADNDLPEELGSALGIFKINRYDYSFREIAEFRDFDSFELQKLPDENIRNPRVDENGRVWLNGRVTLTTGAIFEFKNAYIVRIKNEEFKFIYFETETVGGVSFSFCGSFLEERIPDTGGGDTDVVGVISKYENGKQIAKHRMPFIDWGFE